jgi:hypothetical protein
LRKHDPAQNPIESHAARELVQTFLSSRRPADSTIQEATEYLASEGNLAAEHPAAIVQSSPHHTLELAGVELFQAAGAVEPGEFIVEPPPPFLQVLDSSG